MIEFPLKIPVDELGGETRLYRDYVSGGDSPARELLGGFGKSDPKWEKRLSDWDRSAQVRSPTWETLVERLVEYNRSLGVSDGVVEKLRSARNGNARFVVTGQQPGALGGPLLTLYKAATTVALAQYLEKRFNTPFVPLYWIGSDDVDFQEIREAFLVDCDLTSLSVSIEPTAHVAASPVGGISADAARRVWDAVEPIVAGCPQGEFVSQVVREALDKGNDQGEIAGRIVAALNRGGIAVVDGREAAVKVHARETYLAYFDQEAKVREAITEAGHSLEGLGYHAQLWLGPDSGVFLIDEGQRKKIVEERRAQVRKEMIADVGRFSPGVALRNLVQDYVFQPVAVVLGPAEIAYRAQLRGVYDMLGVGHPVVFPRLTATYIVPSVAALLNSLQGSNRSFVTQLLADPAAFLKRVYALQDTSGVSDAAERARHSFRSGADGFLSAIEDVLDAKSAEKSKKRLADVERRLNQALDVVGTVGKSVARARWPFLDGLGDFVRRKDIPQERYLSLLTPFLNDGSDAVQHVGSTAVEFLEAALDGAAAHVVYSARDGV